MENPSTATTVAKSKKKKQKHHKKQTKLTAAQTPNTEVEENTIAVTKTSNEIVNNTISDTVTPKKATKDSNPDTPIQNTPRHEMRYSKQTQNTFTQTSTIPRSSNVADQFITPSTDGHVNHTPIHANNMKRNPRKSRLPTMSPMPMNFNTPRPCNPYYMMPNVPLQPMFNNGILPLPTNFPPPVPGPQLLPTNSFASPSHNPHIGMNHHYPCPRFGTNPPLLVQQNLILPNQQQPIFGQYAGPLPQFQGVPSVQPMTPVHPKKKGKGKGKHSGKTNLQTHEHAQATGQGQGKLPKVKKAYFEEYWTEEKIKEGLENDELLQGKLRINAANFREAFVVVDVLDMDVFIDGVKDRNRALNGDLVVVKILPKNTWNILKKKYAEDQNKSEDELTNNIDDYPEEYVQMRGKIISITTMIHNRVAIGLVVGGVSNVNKTLKYVEFKPLDAKLPRMMVPMNELPADIFERGTSTVSQAYKTRMFSATITQWRSNSPLALGKISNEIGDAGDIEAETKAIVEEFDIPVQPWSQEILDELPKMPWTIPEEEIANRRDLRNERIITIDPSTTRDVDDAMSCQRLADGTFVVGIHIADVTYFIPPDSALDKEAHSRATTVYLVQRNYPMLPRVLCEELCSLNPGTDRLAFSVFLLMDSDANILDKWIARSVMNSCAKMSYEQAQYIIDTAAIGDPIGDAIIDHLPAISKPHTPLGVCQSVLDLHFLAVKMRARRMENGGLRLDNVKLQFELDQETGYPTGFASHEIKDSNKLIEEFMLIANITVAGRLREVFPYEAYLRRQVIPLAPKMKKCIKQLTDLGINITGGSSGEVQQAINNYKEGNRDITVVQDYPIAHDSQAIKDTVLQLMTQCMQLATYYCPGVVHKKLIEKRLFQYKKDLKKKGKKCNPIELDDLSMEEIIQILEGKVSTKEDEELYRHYALSVPLYTHFTAPIRRYSDIVVHRLLAASLEGKCAYLPLKTVGKIADLCNERKLLARKAQEKSDLVYFCSLLKTGGAVVREAVVTSVLDRAFDVYVPSLGFDERIYLSTNDKPPMNYYAEMVGYTHNKKQDTLIFNWKNGSGPFVSPDISGSDVPGGLATQTIGILSRIMVVVASDNSKIPVVASIVPVLANKPPVFGPPTGDSLMAVLNQAKEKEIDGLVTKVKEVSIDSAEELGYI